MRVTAFFRRPLHRRRPVTTRLQVELLEDRTVPSITILEAEPNSTLAAANATPLGFDAGEDTRVIVKGEIAPSGDRDWFTVQLNAGDVVAGLVNGQSGLNSAVRLVNPAGTLLIGSNNTFLPYLLPAKSPVRLAPSSFQDANFVYVINTAGTYFVEVAAASDASAGKYAMDLVVARPGLESQPIGTKQIVFVDFDGAKVNASKFGYSGTATLSPLAAFLPAWGLTAADENAVMDGILASIKENLSEDVRRMGLNGDFAATGRPGDFDIEIRNSRDHADTFGSSPFVARLVIGGTLSEFGSSDRIVGISEVIDPGNFKTDDEGLVFLDLLSGPAADPDSLNGIAIHRGHTKIELISLVVGRIAAHEAGHFLGNFHTELSSGVPNIMDQKGRLQSLGPDGVLGTHDDFDEDFGVDIYSTTEGYAGSEDTLNTIAFGLSTGKGTGGGGGSAGGGSTGAAGSGSGGFVGFGFEAAAEVGTVATLGLADYLGQAIDAAVAQFLPAANLVTQTKHLQTPSARSERVPLMIDVTENEGNYSHSTTRADDTPADPLDDWWLPDWTFLDLAKP